jgi:choline dehydrogenase
MTGSFDYIVLGAGSAGSALANRLSALADNRVLLLEAGGNDNHIWLKIPLGVGKVMADPRYSWNLSTQPEPHMNGRSIVWHHGRVVGGSSSINGMLVVRGEPGRYDEWAREGRPG